MITEVRIDLELATGWTDVGDDLIADPVRFKRGLAGPGPVDRLQAPGWMSFTLDNTNQNSVGLADAYTPGHANVRNGFRHGTRVRLWIADESVGRYVWAGRIKSILPDPPVTGLRVSTVTCEDKFATLTQLDVSSLALMKDASEDELLQAIVDLMDDPPANIDFDAGLDSYPFAFDDVGGGAKAASVAQDVLQSALAYLYARGDETDGETWRMENRAARTLEESVITLEATDFENAKEVIDVPSTLEQVINIADVLTVPRRVDAAATTVLVNADAPIEVSDGETVEVFLDYRDPANVAEYVGGDDMVAPSDGSGADPIIDWSANTASDGSGSDVTGDVTVTAAFFGARALVEISNASGGTAYVRGPAGGEGLQLRGRGLYRYATVMSRGTNPLSITKFGEHSLPQPLVMPYQNRREIGQAAADYLSHIYGGQPTPERIRPLSEIDDELTTQAILRDIGDKITLGESAVKIDGGLDVFIHNVEGELQLDLRLRIWWGITPADLTTNFLIFDDSVFGTFDENVFGYL